MGIIVRFGSLARGDSDNISDIDILEVLDSKKKIINKKEVHYYTKKRLESLKKVKSLFLVHLKNEGQIIRDEEDWFKDFLTSIPNYKASDESISIVRKYLSILLSITPTEKQKLWWLDCLYVFLRDYLIKFNSQFDIYSFSPYFFAKPLNSRTTDLTSYILTLRKYKSIYRKNLIENIKDEQIFEIKKVLSKTLNIAIKQNNLTTIFNKIKRL